MYLSAVLLLLTLASCVFWIVACWCVRAFANKKQKLDPRFAPPVSILKPVAGLDPQAYDNFKSFCQQDYPSYEVLFGAMDEGDPALPLVERLQQEYPHLHVATVLSSPLGANAKVSNLHALAAAAKHDVLVISDSDMRATPDYLRRIVAPLADENVGLVTCLYRGSQPSTLAAAMGALYVSSTYMPAAVVNAQLIHIPSAFGATSAIRSRDLCAIGGFSAIADHLADDYELAERVAALGKRVVFAPYVIENVLGAESWSTVWQREVRWVRCIRASRPMEYPGLLLSFTLPLAILATVVVGYDAAGMGLIATALTVRWGVGWLIARYTDDNLLRQTLIWLPLRDLLTFGVWCAGVIGREVRWREQRFLVRADGRLKPVTGEPAPDAGPSAQHEPSLRDQWWDRIRAFRR
jgi:ceramide glucosyltransferase